MIERFESNFIIRCDYCDYYAGGFDYLYEVIKYQKLHRWKSEKKGDTWIDKCPNCIVDEN